MTNSELVGLHALIEGRVQGVGFRYFVRKAARKLAVTGWVRNLADGRVEMMVEGGRIELEDLLAIVKRGPGSSSVFHIKSSWGKATGDHEGFVIRPTSREASPP